MTQGDEAASTDVHVALLRGINVGGKNRLRMADFVAILEDLGCRDVRTYIQSGNAVFRAGASLARGLAAQVARHLENEYHIDAPVITRTASELREAVAANPYLRTGADERHLHVVFLSARPAVSRITNLESDRSPPDTFEVVGREIYLHCPSGVARSKLTSAWFDRVLATTSTMRNWKTVRALLALANE